MHLAPLSSVTEEVVEDIKVLLGQLQSDALSSISAERIQEIMDDTNAFFITAMDDGHIVGMATLYVLPKAGKRIGIVEDVVVLETSRGQGIGEKLMGALIEEGKNRGLASISLTSRPSREAAHALYGKLGFQKRDTDVFRLSLWHE